MKAKKPNEQLIGVVAAIAAYLLWGFLPIYWKLIEQVPAYEILAHRFVWSFVFMVLVLLITAKVSNFFTEVRELLRQPKQFLCVVVAALIITVNWGTYIWAVNNEHIVEASLGYYINPLVSVLLGIIVLKERLSFWQTVSFILAAIGVLNMTVNFGSVPWIALTLALSFGFYGLLKKTVNLGAISSITLETLLITPFALSYLAFIHQKGSGAFSLAEPILALLLMGAGAATATPLLLFSSGAKSLPLSVLGFIQYIAPTISLIIGVFLYHEPFTSVHAVSFAFIWTALLIFSLAKTKLFVRGEAIVHKKLHHRVSNLTLNKHN